MSAKPDAANAEGHFERTIAIAREQKARSWELQAATSTARLWREQANCSRPATFSRRSTVGSSKASTRLI
jgi:hypothetical protein